MKPKSIKFTVGIASSCALIVAPTFVSNAEVQSVAKVPARSYDDQLDTTSAQLSAAGKKVRDAKLVLEQTNKEMPAVRDRLAKAQAAYSSARQRTATAEQKVKQAEADTQAAEVEIAKVKGQIGELRAQVGVLARNVYVSGGSWQELEIVLEAKDPAEFAERLVSYRRVAKTQNNALDGLAVAQAKLAVLLKKLTELESEAQAGRDAAAKAQAEAATAAGQAAAAKAELDVLIVKRTRALKIARSDRDQVKAMYDKLLAAQRQALAKSAAGSSSGGKKPASNNGSDGGKRPSSPKPGGSGSGGSGSGGSGDSGGSGTLSWPTPGYSAGGRTGSRIHPVYGYRSCHTGDDIGAPSGTRIKAAAPGRVIYADFDSIYGYHVMISHGNGLVTMYGHQSRMAVSEGDRVSRGQTIGYVGSTGYSTGPHLHFEVHVNGVPYEPMGWFGGSKHPVYCWGG